MDHPLSPKDLDTLPPRGLPRSKEELRARIREAWDFGDRISPPVVVGPELAHRTFVLAIVAIMTAIGIALGAAPAVGLFGGAIGDINAKFSEPIGSIKMPEIAQRSVVLDRNGRTIATLAGEENRVIVPIKDVPRITRNAVLAIEDSKFYEHNGVDLQGLARAMLLNFRSGAVIQGGSTITQQLVKNTLVGNERSVERKIKEARLAARLEQKFSKDEILELYLNETYFGEGVYGIGTAAEYYFGKKVQKLTLAESALLAGVIKAPEDYEPIGNPEASRGRRRLVLKRMVDERMISPARARAADRTKLGAKRHPLPEPKVPYFVEYVKQQILDDERFGKRRAERAAKLFQAGLRIHTTLDLKLQDAALDATTDVLDRKADPDSALVSIEAKTGALRAMVGGRDFDKEKYNLAVQAKRQPGSTFKPVTMVAALDAGMSPALTLDTPNPLKIRDPGTGQMIEVNNYDEQSHGLMDMRTATEQSVNTYYMQLIQKVGPQRVAEMGRRLGIKTKLPAYLSLTLGTVEVSPFELASAYATLANDGVYCKPFAISKVTDDNGDTLVRNRPKCERRISVSVAAAATDILYGVPLRGTGRANGRIGRPNAAKTGTTNNYADAWYAGYTPQFATVVWMGFSEGNDRPLKDIHGLPEVFGGSLPAMIWSRYMRFAHRGLPVEDFPAPPATRGVPVPDVVGKPLDAARALLEEAGFSVTVEEIAEGGREGIVVEQTPAGGATVGEGSVVALKVSDGTGKAKPKPSPSPTGEDD